MDVAFDAARDDLAIAVMPFGEIEKARDQEGLILHEAQQRWPVHSAPFGPMVMPVTADDVHGAARPA
jgi:hypothetical protein